jgi:lipopolysaccharide export system protein LptC
MANPRTEASALEPPAGARLEPLLGRAVPVRAATPWGQRLRELLGSFMPILVMLALALASWWLVKNSPRPINPVQEGPLRSEPDYTMSRFALERFAADGRLKLRIEGDEMRHIPITDRIEIDGVRIRATTVDGRLTLASARQALATGDGSEVQLLGDAQVDTVDARGVPLEMRSDFLHAFLDTEQVKSHLPVQVRHGGTQITAAGLLYDHSRQRLDLTGPTRTVLQPRALRP